MKKLIAIILVAMLTLSFAACSSKENDKDGGAADKQTTGDTVNAGKDTTAADADTTDAQGEDTEAEGNEQGDAKGALGMLSAVWGSYSEDDKFPAAGGDMSDENMTMDGPGKFGIEDTEVLDATLAFPASAVDKIDDAASLVHMMNANTFTCGTYHLKDAAEAEDVASAIKDNVMQRQWMCGFPDKLVIVKVDDYIISFFGENEIIDTFKTNLTAAYASAEVVCEEPIA